MLLKSLGSNTTIPPSLGWQSPLPRHCVPFLCRIRINALSKYLQIKELHSPVLEVRWRGCNYWANGHLLKALIVSCYRNAGYNVQHNQIIFQKLLKIIMSLYINKNPRIKLQAWQSTLINYNGLTSSRNLRCSPQDFLEFVHLWPFHISVEHNLVYIINKIVPDLTLILRPKNFQSLTYILCTWPS